MTENTKNKSNWIDKIPSNLWIVISIFAAILFWTVLSFIPSTARSFPNIILVTESIKTMIDRGVFFKDIQSSLISVTSGFGLGFVIALLIEILLDCYCPLYFIFELWIKFFGII